jgi:predicted amidohydrolase
VGGFVEGDGSGLFNSAALVGPSGAVHVYRKIHLFDRETALFDVGNRPFETWGIETDAGSIRAGVMVCFDWVYPESARCLALAGAELILHPSNLVLPHCQDAMRTRSLENRVFSVTANRTGHDDRDDVRLDFTGRSQIVDPRGDLLVQVPAEGEHVVVREVDLALARDKRITARNELFRDRHPECYGNLR